MSSFVTFKTYEKYFSNLFANWFSFYLDPFRPKKNQHFDICCEWRLFDLFFYLLGKFAETFENLWSIYEIKYVTNECHEFSHIFEE